MVYYKELSIEQEENKHKYNSTGEVNNGRETKKINWKIVT